MLLVSPADADPDDAINQATSLGAITAARRASGQVSSTDDVDMFSFSVAAGQRISFNIDNPTGGTLDSFLRCFDARGNVLGSNDDGPAPSEPASNESYLELNFPVAGTYYVGVSGFGNGSYNPSTGDGDGVGSTGGYMLSIAEVDSDPDDTLASATPLGTLSEPRTRSGSIDANGTDVLQQNLVVDVTDRGSLDQAVARTVEHFGRLDVVFANAGIANDPPLTVAGLTDEMYRKVIDVDLDGVWHTVRAGLPQVIENRGHVLITSSIYAFMNGVVNAPYAMSKAAVEQLGRALRTELAYRGASAGVLYPGWVDTNIAKIAMHDPGPVKELADHAFRGPLGRPIKPERVAKAVADGIEKRAPRVIVPRRWVPFSLLRGVFGVATDAIMERDAKIAGVLERIDRDAPGS
jgi:NAD(P)-dependent dehydrogenase (short-subunit alcohol dehydrogenase family)